MIKFLLIIIFVIFTENIIADSDCDYSLKVPSFIYTVADLNPAVPGTIEIENNDNDNRRSCRDFFLAFTKGWSGNYNRRGLNLRNGALIYYNLYKNSNSTGVLKEPRDITSVNEVLFGSLSKGEKINLNYYFTLAPLNSSSPPRFGTYVDVVQVQVYTGTYTNINRYEGYRDLNLFINVPRFISLSLVDSGSQHDETKTSKTLDFGEIEEGEKLSFDVRVVSNAGYNLKVSSANNGLLKRVGGVGVGSEIQYDFIVAGSRKPLNSSSSNPVSIANSTGLTPPGGARVPVEISILSVLNKDPGNYQDYITLSVISND